MKTAVIIPSFATPADALRRCAESVNRQTVPCVPFFVFDGSDPPYPLPPNAEIIRTERPHADVGNAARSIGAVSAICRGFDALAFLDADNWFDSNHIELMLQHQSLSGAEVCSSGRKLFDPNGTFLGTCPEVDGERFVDTNCLLLTRPAFFLISPWYLMPRRLVEAGDRVVWRAIRMSGVSHIHHGQPTVNYTTRYEAHYRYFGKSSSEPTKRIARPLSETDLDFLTNVIPVGDKQPSPLDESKSRQRQVRVSLCIIVRNQADQLDECLASVKSLFDEIILIDGGSTDRTVEVGLRHRARIVDFPWTDNVAAARNESLRYATGAWVFWLDAEERLGRQSLERLRDLLGRLPTSPTAFVMKQRTPLHKSGGLALSRDVVRLVPNHPSICWAQPVREELVTSLIELDVPCEHTLIGILHLGYLDAEVAKRRREESLRIAREAASAKPTDATTLMTLGVCSYLAQNLEEAEVSLKHALSRWANDSVSREDCRGLLLRCARLLGRDEEDVLSYCGVSPQDPPRNILSCFEEGLVRKQVGELDRARGCFEFIVSGQVRGSTVEIDEEYVSYQACYHLASILRERKDYDAAERHFRSAVDQNPLLGQAWLDLLEMLLEQGREPEAEQISQTLKDSAVPRIIQEVVTAKLLAFRGSNSQAIRTLEEALQTNATNQWLRLVLADLLEKIGLQEEAARHLRHILITNPRQREAARRLKDSQRDQK